MDARDCIRYSTGEDLSRIVSDLATLLEKALPR